MLLKVRKITRIAVSMMAAAASIVVCIGDVVPAGGEFLLTDGLVGEQMNSSVAVGPSGGYIVWQDNQVSDGDGLGISAKILDPSYSSDLAPIRINEYSAGDQENAGVALLKSGGAVFVWQGGFLGSQDVYARFMAPGGTFDGAEIIVNTDRTSQKTAPQVAVLKNGNVIIIWVSEGQDGNLNGVYGQVFSEAGDRIGEEFQVNQITNYNQQAPSVTALAAGGFVVTWTTEVFQGLTYAVDFDLGLIPNSSTGALNVKLFLLGRMYDNEGLPNGNEFGLIAGDPLVAHPVVIGTAEGGIGVAWSRKDINNLENSWDVFYQAFEANGAIAGAKTVVNSFRSGDQVEPQVAALGDELFIAWTGLAQDGYGMGIFGQLISSAGEKIGDEVQINTSWAGNQMQPSVGSDGVENLLVTWSGYVGGPSSFDVFGQRYSMADNLLMPNPPFVVPVNQHLINVSWPHIVGRENVQYELFVDGSLEPVILTSNTYEHQPLLPNSSHSYRLAYRVVGGQRSPISIAATGTTWGIDANYDGLPDDWQLQGATDGKLLKPDEDTDGDGANNRQEFQAGTNPRDSASVLKVTIESSGSGGLWFEWNTQPGGVYQIQVSSDLGGSENWLDHGEPRFAPDESDAVSLTGSSGISYFRVVKIK